MIDEQSALDIRRYRTVAESWGTTAARALVEGDEGATRQAACISHERVAMQ